MQEAGNMRELYMFYKIKPILLIAFIMSTLSSIAHSNEFDLLSDDMLEPPVSQAKPEIAAEKTSLTQGQNLTISDELGINEAITPIKENILEDAIIDNKEAIIETSEVQEPIPSVLQESKEEDTKQQEEPLETEALQEKAPLLPKEKLTKEEENALLKEYEETIDDEIFSKMSELEKESALLTLQLKKEKIQNDIEAVKKQRQAAHDQEIERKQAIEEKKRAKIQEEQKQMLVEQQKLKDKEIEFEKLRQEKLVGQYKEEMLSQKQKWILSNQGLYKNIEEILSAQIKSFNGIKTKLTEIKSLNDSATKKAIKAKEDKQKEMIALKAQIETLKSQIKSMENQNPFAPVGTIDPDADLALDSIYVIMEIRGKENKLIARLLNRDSQSFLAQVGTVLQTGHVVEEITDTYLKANKNNKSEFIYFTSGGSIMRKEPIKKETEAAKEKAAAKVEEKKEEPKKPRKFNVYGG